MKTGIIIYSNDAETVWNAFRIGCFSAKVGDSVTVFLLGKGVETEIIDITEDFHIEEQIDDLLNNNGKILACSTCLKIRGLETSEKITVSTLNEVYEIIKSSDKVLTF